MSIITIRGQLGSGAPDIGKTIASKLGYDYLDREILAAVAAHMDRSEDQVAMKEMPAGTFMGRIIEAMNHAYPGGTARESAFYPNWVFSIEDKPYLESLVAIIKELAGNNSIVIRGRGSQFILKDFPGAMHVLTVAPLKTRTRQVMDTARVNEETAKKEIQLFDSSRREFIKRYFNADLEDPSNYDLVINTEHITCEAAASLVIYALPFKS
jgi:cytidylate kinase